MIRCSETVPRYGLGALTAGFRIYPTALPATFLARAGEVIEKGFEGVTS
jgi:hypothetical protein